MTSQVRTIGGVLDNSEFSLPQPGGETREVKVVALASGKGGVGKTTLAINLAISLTRFGHRPMVVDADMGLGNVDLMLGLTPRYNLSHYLDGKKEFEEIVVSGPSGIHLMPCSSGGKMPETFDSQAREKLVERLKNSFDYCDIAVIDTGGGLSDNIIDFLLHADEVFLVTTPEPTSIMDSFGVVKTLAAEKEKLSVRLMINMAHEKADARHVLSTLKLVTKQFQNVDFQYVGSVGLDPNVSKSVRHQQPIVLYNPASRAARDIEMLAMKLADYDVDFRTERGVANFFRKIGAFFK